MTQAATTSFNVEIDSETKRKVDDLFDSMGLSTAIAVNMFFKLCLLEEAIPFKVKSKRAYIPLRKRLENDKSYYE